MLQNHNFILKASPSQLYRNTIEFWTEFSLLPLYTSYLYIAKSNKHINKFTKEYYSDKFVFKVPSET